MLSYRERENENEFSALLPSLISCFCTVHVPFFPLSFSNIPLFKLRSLFLNTSQVKKTFLKANHAIRSVIT